MQPSSRLSLTLGLALALFVVAPSASSEGAQNGSSAGARSKVRAGEMPDPEFARWLGLSREQLQAVRAKFGLSNSQLAGLQKSTLQTLIWQAEHPNVDLHMEAEKFRWLRLRNEHNQIPTNAWLAALEQKKQLPAWKVPSQTGAGTSPQPLVAGITPSGWTWLGPGNIGGRVRSILVHPTTPSIMWAGGADGGVWKTTNSAASWFPLDDFMANLAVCCMVMDPTAPNTIYVGTGEGFYNIDAVQGAGIFKTTDGGATWTQLSSTANSSFLYVNRLAISPTNHLVILAATRSGTFRSPDGGSSWSQVNSAETLDLQYHPTDGSQCIAGGWNGNAWYSVDSGLTWSNATGLPTPAGFAVGRVEPAYAPSSPGIVYASVDNNSGEIYGSANGGQTYARLNTGNSYLSSQGWYDNCLWVDPTNPNILVVGGNDLWRSTDGGATLTDIGGYSGSIHPDQHVIVNISGYNGTSVRTIFAGNDGGIFKAADIYNASASSGWTTLNNNLGITQFYGAAGNSTSGIVAGGAQDNGGLRYTPVGGPNGWTQMFGGDGGFSASDPSDTNYFYGEYVNLQIYRSTDAGLSANYIYSGITDAGNNSTADFIAPFILDPNNPNTMLAGGASLWVTTNVKAPAPSWTAIKPSTGQNISAIAVAVSNSAVIWVGHDDGSVYFTTNGTSGSPTWTQANLNTPHLPQRECTRLTIDPRNSSLVYATFGGFSSGNVWRTTDSGNTWNNISAPLPSAPVNSLVIKPSDSSSLYVGTEVGVFASADGGVTWSANNDGPANVAVDELSWMGTTLLAVTHGRGIFSILIPNDALVVTPAAGFAANGPVGGPFLPGSQNYSLTNGGTSSLNWSLINTSIWLSASASSGTLMPGGAAANVTVSLNGAANALAAGIYSATVVFSNQTSHLTQSRQFSVSIGQPLVQNGGFETGDFTAWTLVGSGGTFDLVDNGIVTGILPHSGTYFAALGESNFLAFLSQTLPTAPGQLYWLSCWMNSPDGLGPNEFMASWNGVTLFDQFNLPLLGWTNLNFFVTATSPNTVLQFGGRDDVTWLGLDDVSVLPVSAPAFQSVTRSNATLNLVWRTTPNLLYQPQYKTNLTQASWLNLGSLLNATSNSLSATDSIGPDHQRFYRIVMSP